MDTRCNGRFTFVYLYNLYLRCSINSKTNRSMFLRGAGGTRGTTLRNHYCVTLQTQHGSNMFDIFIVNRSTVRFVKSAYLMQWENIPSFYFPSMWLAKRQKHGQRLSKRHLHLSKKLVITYFFGKISRTDHNLRMSVTNSLTDSQTC